MDTRRRTTQEAAPSIAEEASSTEVEIVELDDLARSPVGSRARLAFAATVVVLISLIALSGFPSPGKDRSAIPAPSGGATASAGVQTAVPSRDPSAWAEVELRGFGRGATVEELWALGDRFLAEVETDDGPDGGPYGPVSSALLTSTDGLSWEQVELPVDEFRIEAGVVVDARLVLIGRPGWSEASDWQVWSTQDGEWRREPDPVGLASGDVRIGELAHADGCEQPGVCRAAGWVASVSVDAGSPFDELRVSNDGVQWRTASLPEIGPKFVRGIGWHDDAWNVLALQRTTPPGRTVTGVLRSRDLESWTWTAIAETAGGGRDLAAGWGEMVIVGVEEVGGERLPAAWLWDGVAAWQAIEVGVLPERQLAGIDLALSTPYGFIAASATSGDAWLSRFGLGWHNRPAFEATPGDTVRVLAMAQDIVVAGGRSAAGRPSLWRSVMDTRL